MRLQKQPNRWSCLPTSFAMVVGLPVEKIIDKIGHDGSEIIIPEEKEPDRRRSFHIQELIDICYLLNYAVIPIQAIPSIGSFHDPYNIISTEKSEERILSYLENNIGVITGLSRSGRNHAVAWDGRKIYDPNGSTYGISRFLIETFWAVKRYNCNLIHNEGMSVIP